jgi:hypothetical protein
MTSDLSIGLKQKKMEREVGMRAFPQGLPFGHVIVWARLPLMAKESLRAARPTQRKILPNSACTRVKRQNTGKPKGALRFQEEKL